MLCKHSSRSSAVTPRTEAREHDIRIQDLESENYDELTRENVMRCAASISMLLRRHSVSRSLSLFC